MLQPLIKIPAGSSNSLADLYINFAACCVSTYASRVSWVPSLVERFDRRGTEPFELFRSEFGQKSWNPKKTTKSHLCQVAARAKPTRQKRQQTTHFTRRGRRKTEKKERRGGKRPTCYAAPSSWPGNFRQFLPKSAIKFFNIFIEFRADFDEILSEIFSEFRHSFQTSFVICIAIEFSFSEILKSNILENVEQCHLWMSDKF